jgi:hypothetical protein
MFFGVKSSALGAEELQEMQVCIRCHLAQLKHKSWFDEACSKLLD